MLSDDGAAVEQQGLSASLKGTYPLVVDRGRHLFIRLPFYTGYRDLSLQVFGPWLISPTITAVVHMQSLQLSALSFRTEHQSVVCSLLMNLACIRLTVTYLLIIHSSRDTEHQ